MEQYVLKPWYEIKKSNNETITIIQNEWTKTMYVNYID